MNRATMSKNTPTKAHGWLWKIPLWSFVPLLLCLAAAILSINAIAHNQINGALKTYLTEGGRLEAINFFDAKERYRQCTEC